MAPPDEISALSETKPALLVVAKTTDTTAGVLNPNTEPSILQSAEMALAFKQVAPDAITGARLHKGTLKGVDGRPKLGLCIDGIKKYLYADDMGLTPDRACAVAALPEHAAVAELRRLANYTAAMAGNTGVDMARVPKGKEPEIEKVDLDNVSSGLREVITTKLGDKLTVMHPQPFVEEADEASGGKVILKKGSTTRITQKNVIYTTSDGHVYRIKRGSFGAIVPASAFPAMINYMQSKQKSLEEQAKALEVVLAASDTTLGPGAAEWLHVLLSTYVLKPTPERRAALVASMNEFWQTARLGRSAAWEGIARRYNTALGVYAFLPSWLRPLENPDGSIDGAKRVKEITYAAAASGARAITEHGKVTILAGSSILSRTFEFGTRTAKSTAKTVARKAKQAKKAVSAAATSVTTSMNNASDSEDAYLVTFAKEFFAGAKTFLSSVASAITSPLTSLWKWIRA